jgi:hypothetical protein
VTRTFRIAAALLTPVLVASCSNNQHLTSPATDLGIYGMVETENHVPAPGALVLVESYVDPIQPVTQHDFLASVRSIPDGRFGVGPVPAGQYTVIAGYAKGVPALGASFDSLISYSIVTVTDPNSYRIPERLTLRPPATIVGRMITGIPGWIYVYVVGSSGQIAGSTLNSDGGFTLTGVPQGTWRLMAYDLSGASPVLVVTVPGVVTRFGRTTRVNDIPIPAP